MTPDHPFFAGQRRIILANSGHTDPERITDYIADGGYRALLRAVTEMTPEQIVAEVRRSGLRGRGGAGYPAGLKWELVARQPSQVKYVVCNADEGDPGAFMNRSVLEGDPHRVLEGMAIAGLAVGAHQGYIYVRGESPLAVARLKTALEQARREGLLGERIFESSFNFRIDLRIGAGAYVCGEETALLASIEGKRGQPIPRPPYPPERGLWTQPTLINNVETFANIPTIIANGGDWFAVHRLVFQPGHESFCARRAGLRAPGWSRYPLERRCGRSFMISAAEFRPATNSRPRKPAVLPGGCIPAAHLDLPMDYDSLQSIGTMMGSGGLIVMDTSTCMVDIARYFMEFCREESCGKCIPCRAGTVQMHDILARITRGEGAENDFVMLEELSGLLRATSLCGLGIAAPNPVAEHSCATSGTNTKRTYANIVVPRGTAACRRFGLTTRHLRRRHGNERPNAGSRWPGYHGAGRARPSFPPPGRAASTSLGSAIWEYSPTRAHAACAWLKSKASKSSGVLHHRSRRGHGRPHGYTVACGRNAN